jgi:hypothetical protein
LERLAEDGFLQNNRKLIEANFSHNSQLIEVISSMKNLEILVITCNNLTLEDLAPVFQSCSKLIELRIATYGSKTFEMAEHLKDQLRSGFQKLRCINLVCCIDNGSWPVIQEMLT